MTQDIGILTAGGTILGTSRDKPHRMPVGGTVKNALRLKEKGINVVTLPKTIDNDVAGKDKTVPPDHPWVLSARRVGTNFGD